MAEAELNNFGLLDPGLHPMTLEEVADLFGRFQRSDRRPKLMQKLRDFVKAVWSVDNKIEVIVDGSFIMKQVDEPGDIDIVLNLPANWDFSDQNIRPFEYNVVSPRMVRKLHGFDMQVGVQEQASSTKAIQFFSQVNVKWFKPLGIPVGTTKGLVRIEP